MQRMNDETEGHCTCSAYDDGENEGKVRLFECVLDGTHKSPCFYVVMPEEAWYDMTKNYKWESRLRYLLWRLRHPFYRWRKTRKEREK